MSTGLNFAIVDVFAETPLNGNPLAVVLDADELTDETLRLVAREFQQSETTFVLRPRSPSATLRLRSFTASGEEVVGAGHNALGAWWWLVKSGRVPAGPLRQEIGDHLLDLQVRREGDHFMVAMEQAPPTAGDAVPVSWFCDALGLDAERLGSEPAQVVSSGAPHLLIQARDDLAVDAARPDAAALKRGLADVGAQGCYLYSRRSATSAYARFFNPTVGLWEDPATGSAAAPLAWWLTGGAGAGSAEVTVHQGHSLGRPSRISVIVTGERITLEGSAALTAEGILYAGNHGGSK